MEEMRAMYELIECKYKSFNFPKSVIINFTEDACYYLALELKNNYGYDIYCIEIKHKYNSKKLHSVCKLHNLDLYVDIKGIWTKQNLINYYKESLKFNDAYDENTDEVILIETPELIMEVSILLERPFQKILAEYYGSMIRDMID